jgi:hypothetical protein
VESLAPTRSFGTILLIESHIPSGDVDMKEHLEAKPKLVFIVMKHFEIQVLSFD